MRKKFNFFEIDIINQFLILAIITIVLIYSPKAYEEYMFRKRVSITLTESKFLQELVKKNLKLGIGLDQAWENASTSRDAEITLDKKTAVITIKYYLFDDVEYKTLKLIPVFADNQGQEYFLPIVDAKASLNLVYWVCAPFNRPSQEKFITENAGSLSIRYVPLECRSTYSRNIIK